AREVERDDRERGRAPPGAVGALDGPRVRDPVARKEARRLVAVEGDRQAAALGRDPARQVEQRAVADLLVEARRDVEDRPRRDERAAARVAGEVGLEQGAKDAV